MRPRFKGLFLMALIFSLHFGAHAHPATENLDSALSNSSDQNGIKQALNQVFEQGEIEATRLLMEKYPPETFQDYTHSQSIFLINALSSYGGPEGTGFILETLNALKNTKSPLKASLIYALIKSGVKNKDRIENFLNEYKENEKNPDTLYAIDVMLENLLANLKYGENGDPNDVDVDERLTDMAVMISRPWYQCPDKLWSFDSNPQAIFTDSQTNRVWNLTRSGLEELSSMPTHLNYDFKFDFSHFNNSSAIAVNLRKTFNSDLYYKGSYALYLTLHEGFHQMYQSSGKWIEDKGFQSGSHYPPKIIPRYYRRMIYSYLKAVLQGKIDKKVVIGKAKYWYNKWKNEFPEELQQNVDRNEGTAMYYDVLAVTIGHLGCEASKEKIFNFINENYKMFFQTPQNFRDEGYNIGALSSLLLWEKSGSRWTKQVAQGKSPLELLFSSYAEISDSDYPKVRAKVEKREIEEAKENKENLHGDLENFSSKNYIRVSIPSRWHNERLPLKSQVLPQKMPNDSIFITDEGYLSYQYENKSNFVKALGPLPLFMLRKAPCAASFLYILIHKDDLSVHTENRVAGINPYVDLMVEGKPFIDSKGLKWFCSE